MAEPGAVVPPLETDIVVGEVLISGAEAGDGRRRLPRSSGSAEEHALTVAGNETGVHGLDPAITHPEQERGMERTSELVLGQPVRRAHPADLRAGLAVGERERARALLLHVTSAVVHHHGAVGVRVAPLDTVLASDTRCRLVPEVDREIGSVGGLGAKVRERSIVRLAERASGEPHPDRTPGDTVVPHDDLVRLGGARGAERARQSLVRGDTSGAGIHAISASREPGILTRRTRSRSAAQP